MNPTPLNILLVEDNLGDYRLVKEMLQECASELFNLLHAGDVATAAQILDRERVEIILLDLRLPDGNGLDTLIKMHALAPETPIVVLSHVEDEALAVKAVRIGAQDFLVKSHINGSLLTRSLRYALERRQLEEHLYHLAHHDSLTGLPNRKLFYDRLVRTLASARRHRRSLALFLVDLNEFKQINDTCGHHVGDQLLRQVAERLQSCLRTSDCVARLGGDEFIIYVSDLGESSDATRIAEKILEVLEPAYHLEERSFFAHASLGIALYPNDGGDVELLVRHADAAMYLAKEDGRETSRYRFYSRDLDTAVGHRAETEEALRAAMERNEFVVNYQPQVDLHSGRLIGVEALLRWNRPGEDLVMPASFMPILEESGLILPVGEWVLNAACQQAMLWRSAGLPPVKVAVNLSLHQFRDAQLADRVARALHGTGLPPQFLELEFSEDALHEDEETALATLRQLNAIGVRLALDNFRARSVSLSDLKRFPIHAVKLDRSIVRDMTSNPEDAAIAQAVISIAHVFKMKGLAEGVETAHQADMLRQQACDDAQGFAFGKPLSADALADMLRQSVGGSGVTVH